MLPLLCLASAGRKRKRNVTFLHRARGSFCAAKRQVTLLNDILRYVYAFAWIKRWLRCNKHVAPIECQYSMYACTASREWHLHFPFAYYARRDSCAACDLWYAAVFFNHCFVLCVGKQIRRVCVNLLPSTPTEWFWIRCAVYCAKCYAIIALNLDSVWKCQTRQT